MKLIKPSYEIIPQAPGLEGIYKQIELAGRVCYKSEDKITENSAKDFTDRMVKSNHLAMCEQGTVYLYLTLGSPLQDFKYLEIFSIVSFYCKNKFSIVNKIQDKYNDTINHFYITTNYRVIIENDKKSDLQYLCEPTEYHEKRVTVKFITDIGCGREILRHKILCVA